MKKYMLSKLRKSRTSEVKMLDVVNHVLTTWAQKGSQIKECWDLGREEILGQRQS